MLVAVIGLAFLAAIPAWADSRTGHWSELAFVRKTSDSRSHAAGRQSIPRAQITSLEASRPTKRWRIVGTLVGAAVGFSTGVLAAVARDSLFGRYNGGAEIGFTVTRGVTAAGFLAGWAADLRKITVILV